MCEFTTDTEKRLVVAKVGGGLGSKGLGGWGQQIQMITTEWVNNQVLLYSTENYILCDM